MTETTDLFVPPAADGLPLAALDSATDGASALDASARTPYGRNLLAHALVQLDRDGWLRSAPAAVPSAPADRAAILREAADVVQAHPGAIPYRPQLDEDGGFWWDTRDRDAAADLLRRMADEAQPTPRQWCKCPSCWGWFVEDHPGEDLDELGRDLAWWAGLLEHRDAPSAVAAQQPKEARDPKTVAYQSKGGRLLRCLAHTPEWAAILCGDFHPVTSEDLPDGGICTQPVSLDERCGVDVLIVEARQADTAGEQQ